MLQRLARFAVFAGLCIAILGIGLDFVPDTKPGIHSLQILVILAGLSLAAMPYAARRFRQGKGWLNSRSALPKAATVALLTLLLLELVLIAIGYGTYFPQDAPDTTLYPGALVDM